MNVQDELCHLVGSVHDSYNPLVGREIFRKTILLPEPRKAFYTKMTL